MSLGWAFSSPEDRKRLTGTAILAVRFVAQQWDLADAETADLLGVTAFYWSASIGVHVCCILSRDQLMRASAIVGLYNGLRYHFDEEATRRWLRTPNVNAFFNGDCPLSFMLAGGVAALLATRDHVDALRGLARHDAS